MAQATLKIDQNAIILHSFGVRVRPKYPKIMASGIQNKSDYGVWCRMPICLCIRTGPSMAGWKDNEMETGVRPKDSLDPGSTYLLAGSWNIVTTYDLVYDT